MKHFLCASFVIAGLLGFHGLAQAQVTTVSIDPEKKPKAISPDLFGIFFEDLNYAADGGLYAELIQNRSFEYSSADRKEWNAMTAWEPVLREGGKGAVSVESSAPLNSNNPHYAAITVEKPGGGVGLQNTGFDGIVIKAGDQYEFSVFARQLAGLGGPLQVRIESKDGKVLGEATLPKPAGTWKKYAASIQAKAGAEDARLVLLTNGVGQVGVDVISLFPKKTFHSRPNGLREDLAQTIADIHPRFIRFPGGCLTHGDGLENIYKWKETIGPVETRKEQRNIWRYHQSVGLGYFEYFQFCEDIGAKPLPVVAAGVCCQNSHGTGQRGLDMADMPAYIQDVLDLIEWANGPTNSKWGALRAAAGHPKPFGLQYLGVGNEDKITQVFHERFRMIYDAVRAKHPEITVVGTVGPAPDGRDFDEGWKIADELKVPVVDEHYYKPPQWFLDNLTRYDGYDRNRSKVYVGEYAAHDDRRRTTLRSAIAEAAYMTGLERNGDVVQMASYAPLLGKLGNTQWNPDLIYFTNTQVCRTINYYVQQLFASNSGDTYLPVSVSEPAGMAVSAVRDSKTGDVVVKVVNYTAETRALHLDLSAAGRLASNGKKTVLTGDALAVNELKTAQPVVPQITDIPVQPAFEYQAPANSLTVLRVAAAK